MRTSKHGALAQRRHTAQGSPRGALVQSGRVCDSTRTGRSRHGPRRLQRSRKGVELLGTAAKTSPPGTETIGKIFQAAGGPVLILFDEVLNFLNRHRNMADSFYAFFDNINRATTGTTHCAAVMSLPRSQIEMTEWDSQWQDKIKKVVRRVAKDLIANDETEISEVIRRRLFEDLGSGKIRKNVAKTYGDWCFERRGGAPPPG